MRCQQAEKFRAKAQRPEQSRSHTQYCRYLYYLGRIKAIQLEYTDARDYLQQAARKVCPSRMLSVLELVPSSHHRTGVYAAQVLSTTCPGHNIQIPADLCRKCKLID